MAHLIQPIEIDGTLLCINDGAAGYTIGYSPWRTPGYVTHVAGYLAIDERLTDYWRFEGILSSATLEFGVSCIGGIAFAFTSSGGGTPGECVIELFINGTIAAASTIFVDAADGPTSWSPTLTLDSARACGSVIMVSFTALTSTVNLIDLFISDVT